MALPSPGDPALVFRDLLGGVGQQLLAARAVKPPGLDDRAGCRADLARRPRRIFFPATLLSLPPRTSNSPR